MTNDAAVAVVTADGYIAWLGDWLTSDSWMNHSTGDKLYSATTVAELRARIAELENALASRD